MSYGKIVVDVRPVEVGQLGSGMQLWAVTVRDSASGRSEVLAARNVVFAQGREAAFAQQNSSIESAVEAAKAMCSAQKTEVRFPSEKGRLEYANFGAKATIEDKLNGLAVQSARILKTSFEGDAAFSKRAVL